MSSLTLSFALFLSLLVLVHGDCVIDPSMPCECTNPFLGTDNFFLGDPVKNCNAAKACYVKNLSGCADARQSRGGNRCQSKLACKPEPPSTTAEPTSPETTPSEITTPSEPVTPTEPTPSEPTPSEPTTPSEPSTPSEPTPSEQSTPSEPTSELSTPSEPTPTTSGPTTGAPALQPKCPGVQACSCITPSQDCVTCEVECQADCNRREDVIGDSKLLSSRYPCLATLGLAVRNCYNWA
eukprot:TRINITY_DN1625_c0_g1_i10.p1 TRINITY_DN1625_c0_g1~~TRINITY_DN1625_c0_g1_i10.p1  ORF type:complete len:249 (-),score=48.85 TRINITY_DN1625_c0_g1_i10:112-825(-)